MQIVRRGERIGVAVDLLAPINDTPMLIFVEIDPFLPVPLLGENEMIFGFFIVFAQSSAVMPFIYTLF